MKLLKFTYKKVMSTNDVAIRKIKSGIEQGIIITNEQKKGRGRFGNKWISLKGNLFTTIFYKVNSNYNLKKITQKNCLLIFKTLKTVIKKNISIKYPNDILINSKKICGILQEIIKYNNKYFIIVGIGINIESDVANDSWIGLKEIDNEVDRSKIIIKIASAFEKIAVGKEDFKDWQSEWEKHCVHMHKKIILNLNDSDKVEGIFEGINHNGEMLLSNENGILTFNSGECSVDYASI